jgi:hemoglobin-like flavoprotein
MPVSKHPLCTDETLRRLPAVAVDRALVERLEASFARFGDAADLAETFYERLFREHPSVRAMFPTDMTAQRMKLIDALRAIIDSLRDPDAARRRVHDLGRRHLDYGVEPAHYPIVRDMLVGAMAHAGRDWWSDADHRDWREAVTLVCEGMLEGAGQRMPPEG